MLAWTSPLAVAQSGPVARFVGAVHQDGCPFCCEFRCQTTPTPTPQFDGQGRRIFTVSTSGQFLFVAEAGPGTSNRAPGTEGVFTGGAVEGIADPSGRPSLQILVGKNLGDGTPQVDCRTLPLGGVEGHAALDFNGNVTTSLLDMACRFEVTASSDRACTRNRFGTFSYLGSGTTKQYCMQVPGVARFQAGDTPVAIQFRDITGNLGPRQEIIIRVADEQPGATTPTPTPTRTPALASVAGRVRYYTNQSPVPSATVQVSGTGQQSGSTTGTGTYQFTNMTSGNVTLAPRKVGGFGSPNAITALDAAHVLQAVAGLRTLDARQRIACDVSGNGSLSSLDATRILQRQVGLLTRFAVADQCNSDWIFEPVPVATTGQRLVQPLVGSGFCRAGAIAYEPLAGAPTEQNFLGMLFGDCTGNWTPPAGPALRKQGFGPHALRVRIPHHGRGGLLRVPLLVDGPEPYAAVDLTLVYDPAALRATEVRPLRAADGAMTISNIGRPGEVRIAIASGPPIPTGIPLVAVDFEVLADDGELSISRADVDDLPARVDRIDQ